MDFHAAGHIANPAVQPVSTCQPVNKGPEPDTLDPAGNQIMPRNNLFIG
jgi:hypothetical protein